MKVILLYYVPNTHSVAIETICSEINKSGNKLLVLTQTPKGELHRHLDMLGVENYSKVYSSQFSWINYIRHIFYLIKFCRKHKIDTVWSNLSTCNLAAVIAQYFMKRKVVVFRHHFHRSIKTEGFKSVNRNERMMVRIINRLAKEIVVPSLEVQNGMIEYEKVKAKKISILPYIYDFSQYGKPDQQEVNKIRALYSAKLLILTASRMIKMKRHSLLMPVYKHLLEEGLDIKVLLLDDGIERKALEEFVKDNHLQDKIFFLGLKKNIIDYLAAADLIVHPSITEASSSLIKEAGLVKKPVIVCSGVGDFDQYIENEKNGYLTKGDKEAVEFEKYIRVVYDNPEKAIEIGNALHHTVVNEFSANEKTIAAYLSKA
ncbi:MAG: glycosyltransferase family 4 protein [Chitinophagaceae bacterium]